MANMNWLIELEVKKIYLQGCQTLLNKISPKLAQRLQQCFKFKFICFVYRCHILNIYNINIDLA